MTLEGATLHFWNRPHPPSICESRDELWTSRRRHSSAITAPLFYALHTHPDRAFLLLFASIKTDLLDIF